MTNSPCQGHPCTFRTAWTEASTLPHFTHLELLVPADIVSGGTDENKLCLTISVGSTCPRYRASIRQPLSACLHVLTACISHMPHATAAGTRDSTPVLQAFARDQAKSSRAEGEAMRRHRGNFFHNGLGIHGHHGDISRNKELRAIEGQRPTMQQMGVFASLTLQHPPQKAALSSLGSVTSSSKSPLPTGCWP